MQIGWADPATGISFGYCHNGLYDDMSADGIRGASSSPTWPPSSTDGQNLPRTRAA